MRGFITLPNGQVIPSPQEFLLKSGWVRSGSADLDVVIEDLLKGGWSDAARAAALAARIAHGQGGNAKQAAAVAKSMIAKGHSVEDSIHHAVLVATGKETHGQAKAQSAARPKSAVKEPGSDLSTTPLKGSDGEIPKEHREAIENAVADHLSAQMQKGLSVDWDGGDRGPRIVRGDHFGDDEENQDMDGNPIDPGAYYNHDWNDTGEIEKLDPGNMRDVMRGSYQGYNHGGHSPKQIFDESKDNGGG